MKISKYPYRQPKFQRHINTLVASLRWALGISLIHLQSQLCFQSIFVIFYSVSNSYEVKSYNLINVCKFPTTTQSSILGNTGVLGFLQSLKTLFLRVHYLLIYDKYHISFSSYECISTFLNYDQLKIWFNTYLHFGFRCRNHLFLCPKTTD